MAYASWSVIAGEQPSATKWNILGTNDAAFNNGSGLPSANASAAYVATAETSASTSYADLATTTDGVTVTIGAQGKALISLYAKISNNTVNSFTSISFVASSANTIAVSDIYAVRLQVYAANAEGRLGVTHLLTSLNAGSTVFKMKYKVETGGSGSGTATFTDRRIAVVPL